MRYIDAVELMDMSIENKLFVEVDGNILVCSDNSEEDPFFLPKNTVVHQLMEDPDGQEVVINELRKKGIEFSPKIYKEFMEVKNRFERNIKDEGSVE